MSRAAAGKSIGGVIFFITALLLGSYFTFAAVQGDFGVFRRVEIRSEADSLRGERDRLANELAELQNLTRRLSDDYLDMDLLDQQARLMLGFMRFDEIALR